LLPQQPCKQMLLLLEAQLGLAGSIRLGRVGGVFALVNRVHIRYIINKQSVFRPRYHFLVTKGLMHERLIAH